METPANKKEQRQEEQQQNCPGIEEFVDPVSEILQDGSSPMPTGMHEAAETLANGSEGSMDAMSGLEGAVDAVAESGTDMFGDIVEGVASVVGSILE